ncbi:unnamed protein product [Acanthoscelides obtectus]|uniref:Mitochondrial transcription rescue factor 1 C-terminal domain-containing protein n=1 Tax=Acanthoscelides obtectus TaxID=200917 RepID=A0A9P0MC78_ACAOB|nr:unnamed protein product [Acanthoscelides obtectus]CAK1648752.1 hypothetical protein AOBTE_LOCUS15855 [Acanthoscelides obtectus]
MFNNIRNMLFSRACKSLLCFSLSKNIVTLSRSKIHRVVLCNSYLYNLETNRLKSKAGKSKLNQGEFETDSTGEKSEDDFLTTVKDRNTKTLKVDVPSLRFDAILKAGLGLSRNKIEALFYESRVRLNGEKVLKKSIAVQEDDEIDVIKGYIMK